MYAWHSKSSTNMQHIPPNKVELCVALKTLRAFEQSLQQFYYRSVQHKSINNCDSKYIVVALNKEGIELLSMQKK